MSDAPPPTDSGRDLRSAVRALLQDAAAFGVAGWGTDDAPRSAAVAPPAATVGRARPAAETAPDLSDPAADPAAALARIADEARACRRCPLGGLRTHAVPGQGNPRAELVFVGEAPGADEDLSGTAFVGAAGELLTKMIVAMGLSRDEVFIANVLKCRPPGNRDPAPEESAQCRPFLERQLAVIRPKVICALGAHAARALLASELSVAKLRGRPHDLGGAATVVTYHPAYLLRYPGEKAKTWEDLKLVLRLLGRQPPARAAAT